MKTLALYNLKGGVGKTASSVNLAHLASLDGYRTLVWDLDPQGAASFYFRIRPKKKLGKQKNSPATAIVSKKYKDRLHEQIRGTDFERLDLVPASFDLRSLDLELEAHVKRPERRLRRLLRPMSTHYDLVFLDCPPSISTTSEAVFAAADALLVPTIPTTLSQRTLGQLEAYLKKNGPKTSVWPFFCMYERRKIMHRTVSEDAVGDGRDWLGTPIPYAADVEKMGIHRAPVTAFAPNGKASAAYRALWQEVRRRLVRI